MQRIRMILKSADSSWGWVKVIWPFLTAVVLLVGLAAFSLDILSSARAYVGAESLWSKGQQDAVTYLTRYIDSHAESDYQQYLKAIAVPLGDRKARQELDEADPIFAIARQGLLQARNHPDDIAGMIRLFRNFRHVSFMSEAIAIWEEADRLIADLNTEATWMHGAINSGNPDPEELRSSIERIRQIDLRLRPLEENFSFTLGDASRKVQALLLFVTLAIAAALITFGSLISRAILTRSKVYEAALRISEERLQLAMRGSNDGFWDWDIAEDRMYYSPQLKKLFGFPEVGTRQKAAKFLDYVHPHDLNAINAALVAHLRDNLPYDVEFRIIDRSGSMRWVRTRAQAVRDAAGRAVRMAGCVSDITDRKQVEEQLYAAKERAHVTLESIGDAVITVSTDGLIEYLNPAAELLTGRSLAEARGAPLEEICCLINEATRKSEPELLRRILADADTPELKSNRLLLRNDGSEVAVDLAMDPIRDRENRMIGIVLVLHDVSKDREYASQLAYQASHDELTGLVNRREFERRLTAAMRTTRDLQRQHAVLYLDLDQFKIVNDTCGHAAGDELIRQIGVILQKRLRDGDTLARLGGDEFGVLLENCSPEHSARIAETLRQTVCDFRFGWTNRSFSIGCSIGLINLADDSLTLAQVMSAVDASCYMAKEKGRNRVHEYRQDDLELSIRHGEMQWANRINEALANDRFCLYSLEIRELHRTQSDDLHFEILLRMLDEQGNVILPQTFIPAAERYNLMSKIDRWVVAAAFSTLSRLKQQGTDDDIRTCTINLSGTTIGDGSFVNFVREQQRKFGINQQVICFEISETAAIANMAKATSFIQELRAMGYRFALDDFGAGMSSFAYLKHLPVDFIKIDGGFVKDILNSPTDHAMVEAINKIGRLMGKKTIAEFATSEQIIARLAEMGVDFAQGYGIGKPQPFSSYADAEKVA